MGWEITSLSFVFSMMGVDENSIKLLSVKIFYSVNISHTNRLGIASSVLNLLDFLSTPYPGVSYLLYLPK